MKQNEIDDLKSCLKTFREYVDDPNKTTYISDIIILCKKIYKELS